MSNIRISLNLQYWLRNKVRSCCIWREQPTDVYVAQRAQIFIQKDLAQYLTAR